MATEIQMWEIVNGKLAESKISMVESGRKETEDLEEWIKSDPKILGDDVLIIGEQVKTKKGPLDFLGIDSSGNIVIIELKRDMLPREALAQAIDYASDISSWNKEKLNEECFKYTGYSLEDYLKENFDEEDLGEISINHFQKILLVGTEVEESLQRMIEWLSDNYDMGINVLIFKYNKTKSGDEILARTMIIPEEIEKEKSQRHQRRIFAERHVLWKEFWIQLLEQLNKKTNLFGNISPGIYSWIGTGAGKTGIMYNFVVSNKYTRCEIYLDAGKDSNDMNKQRFDKLFNNKHDIESKFGTNLLWDRLNHRRASRISFDFKEDSLRNKENWDKMQEKMIDAMIKLINATKDYIKQLD